MLPAYACVLLAAGASACSFAVANWNVIADRGEQQFGKANFYNQLRGPDATNVQSVRDWTFVHNLLSMTGAFTLQPFTDQPEGDHGEPAVVALFNGEIYNYRKLAHELAGDENVFKSDGFAIVPAYKKWGERFVQHLHGEFAIVVVDYANGIVILSTDVFSTKPLWHATWREGGANCFLAASYESVLEGLGAPEESRLMAAPNEALVLDLAGGVRQRLPVFLFDLRQHKTTADDWVAAFREAVRVRSTGVKHEMFIGLSSGYDSGAIMLALEQQGKSFFAYSVRGREDSMVVRARVAYCEHARSVLIQFDNRTFAKQRKWLQRHAEPYSMGNKWTAAGGGGGARVREPGELVSDSSASIGLSFILSQVRAKGGLIYMSGSGADETISDYGMDGRKLHPHSCFGGVFPANLSQLFPRWTSPECSFYYGTQRAYLMKEELTGGAHGIETRYPFLDPKVVQEYLWLTHTLKNSDYKMPVSQYMRDHDFPNAWKQKKGFGGHKNMVAKTTITEMPNAKTKERV